MFLWDVATATIIRKFRGHDAVVNAARFSPNSDVLVTGGGDQAVKVWDCRSRSVDAMQVLKAFHDSVMSVAVTARCAHERAGACGGEGLGSVRRTHTPRPPCTRAELIAGSVDGSVRRFDVRMGRVFTGTLLAVVHTLVRLRAWLAVSPHPVPPGYLPRRPAAPPGHLRGGEP